MPGKISELVTRLTAALAARTHKLEILDSGDTTLAATGTNKYMMLEDVVDYTERSLSPWRYYRGTEGWPHPRENGRPFQTAYIQQYHNIEEWRPYGRRWPAPVLNTPVYWRCDLLSAIPPTDYEVTFYSDAKWALTDQRATILCLGSGYRLATNGGFFEVEDAYPGSDGGFIRCGGAYLGTGPLDARVVRFGRWDGLCHVQTDGAEKTSATDNSSWDGTGPIYIGGFPAQNSWGQGSVAYTLTVRRRSTGKVLASWDYLTPSGGTDAQGNTWTVVGTGITTASADWVVVGNTVAQYYSNSAALFAAEPYPQQGSLAFLANMGSFGNLMVAEAYTWKPLGMPVFTSEAARDGANGLTDANVGNPAIIGGYLHDGDMCMTLDTDTVWVRAGNAWKPLAAQHTVVKADTSTAYSPYWPAHGGTVTLSNAAAITVTLPSDVNDGGMEIGEWVDFIWWGVGQPTFVAGVNAFVYGTPGLKIKARYGKVRATKITANEWHLTGDLSA